MQFWTINYCFIKQSFLKEAHEPSASKLLGMLSKNTDSGAPLESTKSLEWASGNLHSQQVIHLILKHPTV